MTFVSTKIERTGDKTGTITGNLTLTGITKPMVLNATFVGEAPGHVGFSAVGEIDINDYQMKKAIQFRFGPKIEIRIEAEANKK